MSVALLSAIGLLGLFAAYRHRRHLRRREQRRREQAYRHWEQQRGFW